MPSGPRWLIQFLKDPRPSIRELVRFRTDKKRSPAIRASALARREVAPSFRGRRPKPTASRFGTHSRTQSHTDYLDLYTSSAWNLSCFPMAMQAVFNFVIGNDRDSLRSVHSAWRNEIFSPIRETGHPRWFWWSGRCASITRRSASSRTLFENIDSQNGSSSNRFLDGPLDAFRSPGIVGPAVSCTHNHVRFSG